MGSKHDKDVVQSLWNEGKPLSYIAEKVKATRNAMAGLVHRMRKEGLILHRRPGSNNNIPRPNKDKVLRRVSTPRRRKPAPPSSAAPVSRGVKASLPPITSSPAPLRIPFLETRIGQCRWVLDDGTCCGRRAVRSSWCRHHAEVCFKEI